MNIVIECDRSSAMNSIGNTMVINGDSWGLMAEFSDVTGIWDTMDWTWVNTSSRDQTF